MIVTRKFVIDKIMNSYRDSGEYSFNLLRAMEDEYNEMSNYDLECEFCSSGLFAEQFNEAEEEDFEVC